MSLVLGRVWDGSIFLPPIYSALNLVCGKETSDISGVRLSRRKCGEDDRRVVVRSSARVIYYLTSIQLLSLH